MMGETTGIQWTDATHNFWYGCRKVSAGCRACYAERDMKRFGRDFGTVTRAKQFNAPMRWKGPKRVFANSWSDFFIADADDWRPEAWDIIWTTPHLTYLIPTKRPERIPQCLPSDWGDNGYPNVWLGVSVENMDHIGRIEELLRVPAAVHWISAEPLLGPLDLSPWLRYQTPAYRQIIGHDNGQAIVPGIEWIVAGGESGPGYRVCDKTWLTGILEQCRAARVPFFLKQLGGTKKIDGAWGGDQLEGRRYHEFPA